MLTRILVGFAFIPSGLKKALGERFTSISVDNPIGFFFEALYQTGIYWQFLGLAQLLTALLLMSQRFATLGAILFFFISSNIWIITISMNFTGTWIITSLMMLAAVLLLIWDLRKISLLVMPDNFTANISTTKYPTYNKYWIITGLLLFTICIGLLLIGGVGK